MMVSVELPPVLPLANDVGLKAPVLAPGRPVTLKVTSLASVPPCVATVIVNVADPPAATVWSPDEEFTLKSVPVAVMLIVCGLPEALSAMLIAAAFAPVFAGVTLGVIPQFAPAANVLGERGQVFVWLNSLAFAPVIVKLLIVNGPVPEFVSVTAEAEVVALT